MTTALTGASVTRVEDEALLRGESSFVANLDLPNAAVVHFFTSQVAHAMLETVDVAAARSAPDVLAVVTAEDIASAGLPPVLPGHNSAWPQEMAWPILATDRVRYVGQPIAAIVAESATAAADAAENIIVEYRELPAVIDPVSAADNPTKLFDGTDSNVVIVQSLDQIREGATPIDFGRFEVVVTADIVNQRIAPAPLEGRVAAAEWIDGRLVQYASCQGAHPIRNSLASYYGLDSADVRVVTADVGGSFGSKARLYAEDALLGHLARLVERPVRWVPNRSQDMTGLGHSRAQHQHVTIAGDSDGRIRAIEIDVIADGGAHPASQPAQARNTGFMLPGPYDIAEVYWRSTVVVTNTTPVVAYRGAGRPESGALLDRLIDMFAAETGVDPVEVRRRNLLRADQLPWENPSGLTYDSGDYLDALDTLLRQIDVPALRSDQTERRTAESSRQLGVGFSVFIDRTAGVRGAEYGSVQLRDDGTMRVLTGSSPYGQGHYTTWAQLVSERTGVAIGDIEVVHGDTDIVPRGGITGGSRSAQKAGAAVSIAADELVEVARSRAADLLEASIDDVVLDLGGPAFHVAGAPSATRVTWREIADDLALVDFESEAPIGETDQIVYACESDYENEGPSVPYGAFAAVVEVDTETGEIELTRMVTVNDVGTMINEMIVEGQVHGALGQAIGQALWEDFVYDESGTPLTSSLLDYGLPSAVEMPSLETAMTVHATPTNILGAKGVGEPGCVGGVPAIQNAVVDALGHLGVRHLDLPVTPERVWQAISAES